MSWKTIRTVFILFLVGINIVLFWMGRIARDNRYTVTEDNMQIIYDLYEKNGIEIRTAINRTGYPKKEALLGTSEALDRSLVESFLGPVYQTVYLNGRQSRYSTDSASLTLDPENHRLQLRETTGAWTGDGNEEEAYVKSIVEMLEADPAFTEGEWVLSGSRNEAAYREWIFTQKVNGEYRFYNRLTVRSYRNGTRQVGVQYYATEGYSRTEREIRPLDELLYGAMRSVYLKGGETDRAIVDVRYGYDVGGDSAGVYAVEFVLSNGRTVRMNAFTGEVLNQQT